MSSLNLTGIWWDQSNEKVKVAGTLTFNDKEGGILSLVGVLGGLRALAGQSDIEIIHGIADNKIVTIYNAFTKSVTTAYPGPDKHTLQSSYVFIGAHLIKDELVFNRVDISTEYLPEFVNHSSLSSTISQLDKQWSGLKAEVTTQEPLLVGSIAGGKVKVRFGWSQDSDRFRNVTLHEKCAISIELDKKHKLDDLMSAYVRPTQDLITLATDRPNAVTGISLQSPDIQRDGDRNVPIEYYHRFVEIQERKSKDSLLRSHMIFTLDDLQPKQFNEWLKVHQKFGPAVGILFGQRYSQGEHLENLLLNSVSAAEAYHRRRFKNTVLDKSAWKAKKKLITSKLDKKQADFINSALQFANEKRLKTRLEEILSHSGLEGDLVKHSDSWNKEIRDYRNTLTHYDPDSPTEITDYDRLFRLAESLSWIMLACLMNEMGFDKKTTLGLLKENQRYIFTRKRLQDSHFTGIKILAEDGDPKKS